MPVTPFKAMKFKKNDVITKDDMDQMNSNLQYLEDMTPHARFYKGDGTPMDIRSTIIGGRTRIRKNKKSDDARVRVSFPAGTFDADCHPHVTTGIIAEHQTKIFCVVNGPGVAYPNANGFDIQINIAAGKKHDKIVKEFWVAWHAFGYRVDELSNGI